MVKTVQGVAHVGLRDWVIQRLSAVVMAIYFTGLVIYFLTHHDLTFAEWHGLFAQTWVKIATMMNVVAMLYHAWIGVWTIFTDYVKCSIARAILNAAVFLLLFACFFWALFMLWSV